MKKKNEFLAQNQRLRRATKLKCSKISLLEVGSSPGYLFCRLYLKMLVLCIQAHYQIFTYAAKRALLKYPRKIDNILTLTLANLPVKYPEEVVFWCHQITKIISFTLSLKRKQQRVFQIIFLISNIECFIFLPHLPA